MARHEVHNKNYDLSQVPSELGLGVEMMNNLRAGGVWDEVATKLRLGRQGGFAAAAIVAALVWYFSVEKSTGIKGFFRRHGMRWRELAAIAGMRGLPTPASLSRALGRVSAETVRDFTHWWLADVVDVDPVLKHPATQWSDAQGGRWHVLDYDPTPTVLRQRALPPDEDGADVERKGPKLAAPGHFGRKRGDLKINRSVLQHAGSGLWFDMRVEAGNGDRDGQLGSALEATRRLMVRLEHPLERTILRADGEFGGLPSITLLKKQGIPFVTRLSRYSLLDRDEVRRVLQKAVWAMVPSSGSGPQRGAVDVGWVLLEPVGTREQTAGLQGQRVRLIVSRYGLSPTDEGKAGRGKEIDRVVYELFGTTVDADAWPAASVVELYYGRCAQECRFSQEDRELELDRIFAYHGPGQELACVVGAFVWNWTIAAGFRANPPPTVIPAQSPSILNEDNRPLAQLAPREPVESTPDVADAEREPDDALVDDAPAVPPVSRDERDARRQFERGELRTVLGRVFPTTALAERGWAFDRGSLTLTCPRGELFQHRTTERSPPQVRFRGRPDVCKECPLMLACRQRIWRGTHSADYHPSVRVGPADLERILSRRGPSAPRRPTHRPPLISPSAPATGHLAPMSARFLPSAARARVRQRTHDTQFSIQVIEPTRAPNPPRHPFVAIDLTELRHGRRTRVDYHNRNRLPQGVIVQLTRASRENQPPHGALRPPTRAPGSD